MTYFSVNQAAKETGKSPSTISRAIKSGKMTAYEKNEDGSYKIDASELFRVFPQYTAPLSMTHHAPPTDEGRNSREIELLERLVDQREETIKIQNETIEDLRRRLDETQGEARQANERFSLWLEHKPVEKEEPEEEQQQAPRQHRWWHRKKAKESELG